MLRHWNISQINNLRLAVAVTVSVLISFIVAWPGSFIMPVFICVILSSGGPAIPINKGLALLVMIGLLGGMAQYLMTLSYRHIAIGSVAPLKYLTIVFGGIIGYLVWSETPDAQSMIGISIIVVSGLYTLHRELLRGSRI